TVAATLCGAGAATGCATNTGCSTAAFADAADGWIRGQNAKTRSAAQQPAIRPATIFHSMGTARPPLLHQAAPAREVVIEPIGILGFRSSAGVGRRFRRRAKRIERRVR